MNKYFKFKPKFYHKMIKKKMKKYKILKTK